MNTNVPQTTDKTHDPALACPDGYAAPLAELIGEISRLMLRGGLPEARVEFCPAVNELRAALYIGADDTTAVDAWCAALGLCERDAVLYEYDDRSPIWTYHGRGKWLGARVEVSTSHEVPTGDELIEQPAVAA